MAGATRRKSVPIGDRSTSDLQPVRSISIDAIRFVYAVYLDVESCNPETNRDGLAGIRNVYRNGDGPSVGAELHQSGDLLPGWSVYAWRRGLRSVLTGIQRKPASPVHTGAAARDIAHGQCFEHRTRRHD